MIQEIWKKEITSYCLSRVLFDLIFNLILSKSLPISIQITLTRLKISCLTSISTILPASAYRPVDFQIKSGLLWFDSQKGSIFSKPTAKYQTWNFNYTTHVNKKVKMKCKCKNYFPKATWPLIYFIMVWFSIEIMSKTWPVDLCKHSGPTLTFYYN